MRRVLVLLALLVALGGCSDDGKQTVDSPVGEVEVPDEVADALDDCEERVTSGEEMTADEVEACADINLTTTLDCPSANVHLIAIGDQQWRLREGEAAQQVDEAAVGTLSC